MECYYDSFWVRGEGSARYSGFYGVFLGSAPSVSVEIYAILPEGFLLRPSSHWTLSFVGFYLIVKNFIRCKLGLCIEII